MSGVASSALSRNAIRHKGYRWHRLCCKICRQMGRIPLNCPLKSVTPVQSSRMRAFNAREGIEREHDTLPDRFFDRPLDGGPSGGMGPHNRSSHPAHARELESRVVGRRDRSLRRTIGLAGSTIPTPTGSAPWCLADHPCQCDLLLSGGAVIIGHLFGWLRQVQVAVDRDHANLPCRPAAGGACLGSPVEKEGDRDSS